MAAAAAAVVVFGLAVMACGAAAQSTTTGGCTQTLIGMSPCLNYITGNETAPSRSCCGQLATVAASRPECLCAALNMDPAALGLGAVNKTAALGLPAACSVKTPSVTNCNGALAPTESGTPAGQTPAAGTGSKSTPATYNGAGVSLRRGSAGLVAAAAAMVYAVSVL